MAHLNSTIVQGNLTVTGKAQSSSFIKLGGTGSEFLMADGSTKTNSDIVTKAAVISALEFTPVSSSGVTSVGLTASDGLVAGTSAVTTSGSLSVGVASGRVIPTTTEQTTWNEAATWVNSNKTAFQPLDGDLTEIADITAAKGYLYKKSANSWEVQDKTFQEQDADLTAIAALTATQGFLKKSAANTWALDNTSYLPTSGGQLSGPVYFANTSANNITTNYLSAGGGFGTGSGRLGLKLVAIDQSDAQMGLGVDLTGGSYELTVATGRKENTGASKIVFATHTAGTTAYKTLATLLASGAENPTATFNVAGSIQENGTALSSKYLGIGAKAADSAKLDGKTASAEGNRNANQVVLAKANGQINSEYFTLTSGATSAATMQYDSSRKAIKFVFA